MLRRRLPGATGSEAENSPTFNVAYQTTVNDPDTVGTLAYSLAYSLSGTDAALFDISSTGAVTFKSSPNFEAPADANGDNQYQVTVHANDGVNDTPLAVTITVTDVNDIAPVITTDATQSVP